MIRAFSFLTTLLWVDYLNNINMARERESEDSAIYSLKQHKKKSNAAFHIHLSRLFYSG